MNTRKILQTYQCGQNPLPELRKETGLPVHFEYENTTNINWAMSAGPEKTAETLGYDQPPICVFLLTDSDRNPVQVTILRPTKSGYKSRHAVAEAEEYV